ncbi:MAG: BrxE family protein [Candidatus Flexifilum sp.]
MFDLTSQDLERLLLLQLLVARAGQRDSLQWWDDESLTVSGAYVVERVFVGAPRCTARRLALRAAAKRHAAMLADRSDAIHLFRLDSQRQVELAFRGVPLPRAAELDQPIATLDVFRERLLTIIGTPPEYHIASRIGQDHTQHIRLVAESPSIQARAAALAWAYTAGKVGKPVFPYLTERS